MTENEQKQQLSIAYVHAVASRAGYTCQANLVDDDSVDVVLGARGYVHHQAVIRSPRLEVQLKATASAEFFRDDHVAFPLPVKNYDELREPCALPRLLVVLLLPEDPALWLTSDEDSMISRKCAYWTSLEGRPETPNTSTVTVVLPRSQRFNAEGLRSLMERASRREPL